MIDKVSEIIKNAVLQLNEYRNENEQIEYSDLLILFGSGALIDSLDLVNVITEVEETVSDDLGIRISLTDDRAMTREISPYDSVATLRDYILELLDENNYDINR